MKLAIRNCPESVKFKPYVKKSVECFLNQLFDKNSLRYLDLTIQFVDVVDGIPSLDGTCEITGYNSKNKPRKFKITVCSKIGAINIFKTLAHELVHVRQFYKGELDDMLCEWKGEFVDTDKVDYYRQPWEIEAYGVEIGLFVKFVGQEKLWTVFKGIKNPRYMSFKPKKILWK